MNEFEWTKDIIGKSVPDAIIHQTANDWASHVSNERDVGVIAGTVSLGLARLMANFEEENDGLISVSETRIAGVTDHLTLPVSHMGMLVSANVVDQSAAFIKNGSFLR